MGCTSLDNNTRPRHAPDGLLGGMKSGCAPPWVSPLQFGLARCGCLQISGGGLSVCNSLVMTIIATPAGFPDMPLWCCFLVVMASKCAQPCVSPLLGDLVRWLVVYGTVCDLWGIFKFLH